MEPNLEKYRPGKGNERIFTGTRITPETKRSLDLIAGMELCPVGDLVLEGIARVVEDRMKGDLANKLDEVAANLRAEGRP